MLPKFGYLMRADIPHMYPVERIIDVWVELVEFFLRDGEPHILRK